MTATCNSHFSVCANTRQVGEEFSEYSSSVLREFLDFFFFLRYAFANLSSDMQQLLFLIFQAQFFAHLFLTFYYTGGQSISTEVSVKMAVVLLFCLHSYNFCVLSGKVLGKHDVKWMMMIREDHQNCNNFTAATGSCSLRKTGSSFCNLRFHKVFA